LQIKYAHSIVVAHIINWNMDPTDDEIKILSLYQNHSARHRDHTNDQEKPNVLYPQPRSVRCRTVLFIGRQKSVRVNLSKRAASSWVKHQPCQSPYASSNLIFRVSCNHSASFISIPPRYSKENRTFYWLPTRRLTLVVKLCTNMCK